MAGAVKWSMEADYLQACNCEFGCPCEFEAPPSHGFCEGIVQWQISRGNYGDIKLDGLGCGAAAHWPGAMHLGGGTGAYFVDERADAQQRDALSKILTGDAGGMPFEIVRMTFAKVLPVQYVPFEFHADGRRSRGRMGDAVFTAIEPIKNPASGGEESIRIEHSTGFLFKTADIVAARELKVACGELNFAHPGKAAFIAKVSYHN
jgi:hypothetical protein